MENNRVLIAAFGGWNDAGSAASVAVNTLINELDTEFLDVLDSDPYYDLQVHRPTVAMVGDERRITWPTTRVFEATEVNRGLDLILVDGIEPSFRWRDYCNALLSIAAAHAVDSVVLLGALMADVPHTQPIPISKSSSDAHLRKTFDFARPTYEGPTGIVGVLADMCARLTLPEVSLWAAIPAYAASATCPKATLALLDELQDYLDTVLPSGELIEASRAWQRGVDAMVADDTELADFVAMLERDRPDAELPQASGEQIAAEFERYLRRRNGEPGE